MHYFQSLGLVAAGTQGQGDPFVIERNKGFCFGMNDRHQVTTPPDVMALTLNKLPWSFPRLEFQLPLLLVDPIQFRDRVRSGHIQTRCANRDNRDYLGEQRTLIGEVKTIITIYLIINVLNLLCPLSFLCYRTKST